MKKQHINLTKSDRQIIKQMLVKGVLKVRTYNRACGLQMLDAGMSYQEVGKQLGVNPNTVSNWAKKYRAAGLSFLTDAPRSGRPIGISGAERAKVTALACSKPPEGYGRWSLRLLADRLVELECVEKISHTMVGHILKKTN